MTNRRELIGLRCGDVVLGTGAHVRCRGKGRKDRSTPLRADTAAILGVWLDERADTADRPLFVSNRNGRLSRDAVERIVRKYVALGAERYPTLKGKHVTPHYRTRIGRTRKAPRAAARVAPRRPQRERESEVGRAGECSGQNRGAVGIGKRPKE